MDCETAQQNRLPAIFDGLDETEAAALERHISGCERCRAYDQELDGALGLLSREDSAPRPAAWEALKARLVERGAPGAAPSRVTIAVACVFCKGSLSRNEAEFCGSCLAPHHPDCFREHGRCANLGCGETRTVKPLPAGGAARVSPPAASMNGKGKATRRLGPGLLAFLLLTTAGSAFVGYRFAFAPQALAPLPEVTSAPAPRALSRPVLKPLRSAARQVLDPQITALAFDAQGRPWLSVTDRRQSFYLEDPEALRGFGDADALFASRGGEAIEGPWYGREATLLSVIESAAMSERGARELLLFHARPHSRSGRRFVFQGLESEEFYFVDLTAKRSELRLNEPELSAGFKALTAPSQDAWGRRYSRDDEGLVVLDPWAEGRFPQRFEKARGLVANPRASRDDSEPGSVLIIEERSYRFRSGDGEFVGADRVVQAQALTRGGFFLVFEGEDKDFDALVLSRSGQPLKEITAPSIPEAVAACFSDLRARLRPDCVPFGPWQLLWDRRAEAIWMLSPQGELSQAGFNGFTKVDLEASPRRPRIAALIAGPEQAMALARLEGEEDQRFVSLRLEGSILDIGSKPSPDMERRYGARDVRPAYDGRGALRMAPAIVDWPSAPPPHTHPPLAQTGPLDWTRSDQGVQVTLIRSSSHEQTKTAIALAPAARWHGAYDALNDRLLISAFERRLSLSLCELSRVTEKVPGLRESLAQQIQSERPLDKTSRPEIVEGEAWFRCADGAGYLVLSLPPRPRFER